MRKTKKFLVFISFLVLLSFSTITFGSEKVNEKSLDFNGAEEIIIQRTKMLGITDDPNSEEYQSFLLGILLNDKDDVLAKRNDYIDLRIYASEVLYQMDLNGGVSDDVRSLSIDEISEIANNEEKELQQRIAKMPISNFDEGINLLSNYSGSAAAQYALNWSEHGRKKRNFQYRNHSLDCTNFASQAVHAGGKSMNQPIPTPNGITETTSRWYSQRYTTYSGAFAWRESTSFIRVIDFYSYWSPRIINEMNYTHRQSVINYANTGDIVQLREPGGRRYHSIIVTEKLNNNLRVTYHTDGNGNDVRNQLITTAISDNNRFTVLSFTRG